MRRVLITGANGFIGRRLCAHLRSAGFFVRGSIRIKGEDSPNFLDEFVIVGEIDENTNWSNCLEGMDYVVHLAARVHILGDSSEASISAFRSTNVQGTQNLARQALESGIRRFIFLSSIGVYGQSSNKGTFSEICIPKPETPYAQSKLEAEQVLGLICKNSTMGLTVIRPPLVYGFQAPGNFSRLLHLVKKVPILPLGSIRNTRSFIGVDNLCDFIVCCLHQDHLENETYTISDGQDISTSSFVKMVKRAIGSYSLIIPFPSFLLRLVFKILKKDQMARQLLDDLQIDSTKAFKKMGWTPPVTLEDGITLAVVGYHGFELKGAIFSTAK